MTNWLTAFANRRQTVHVARMAVAWILLLVLSLMGGWTDLQAKAGTGQVHILPMPRVKVRSGLRVSIDTRWVMGDGYRPVRVRISPIVGGPAVADRDIEIRLRPSSWYGQTAGAVTATVHLPQGALYGEATIDIPQTNAWSSLEVDCYEDGNDLPDLQEDSLSSVMRYYIDSTDGTPAILVVNRYAPDWPVNPRVPVYTQIPNGSLVIRPELVRSRSGILLEPMVLLNVETETLVTPVGMGPMGMTGAIVAARKKSQIPGVELQMLPDIRTLAGRFPKSYVNGYITADRFSTSKRTTDAETMRLANDLSFIDILPPQALPDRWLSYTGVDVMILSLEDAQLISSQYPEKWKSIQDWLSTGAVLCVYGTGQDFKNLETLEKTLNVPALPAVTGQESRRGWTVPNDKHYVAEINVLDTAIRNQRQSGIAVVESDGKSTKEEAAKRKNRPTPHFVYRTVDLGCVVAMSTDNPFPGDAKEWSWVFNSIPPRNWLWYQRVGISNTRENQHFWNFLIPDIGGAPVMSFLALITLFALVIGPLNYFVLLRRSRLYLLMVTVPAGAFFVTLALFVYATTADGLGTLARVRSCTMIDQRKQRAIGISRQSYYAGFAPSRGLSFPLDAAVYPLEHEPVNRMGMGSTRRHLIWGDEQHLARGYFTSRSTSQMVVVEPRETKLRLKVEEPGDGKPPRVTNELETEIERLLLCDATGKLFATGKVSKGGTVELLPTEGGKETEQWRGLYGANRPVYPEGFDPGRLENVSGIFGSRMYYSSDVPLPMFDTSVMETKLRETMTTDFRWLQPHQYIAVVGRPPTVSLGTESPQETAGFHVIVGTW